MSRPFATLLVAASVVGAPLVSFAQTVPTSVLGGDAATSAPVGTVDCFKYYSFGSVQANIHSNVTSAVSGTPITFTGTLTNANPYPIVDGSLYVKVFRDRGSSTAKDVNGPDVVDEFFVRQGIDLPAKGSMPVAFTWDIPSYAKSGNYKVATFFTSANKFNLLGLSFTDDIIGNTASFSVSGELTSDVSFDKTSVTVAGQTYRFAAFAPQADKSAPIPVVASVSNTTDKPVTVSVGWDLYYWDAQLAQNRLDHKDVLVMVGAHSSAPVSYSATDARYPVYLLVGTLHWGNAQSIINVRFVRSGIDRTRINFPGITQFPLKAGERATLFSCLHNAGPSGSVPNGRLELSLVDDRGALIHEYTYTGAVTGAMMGAADTFTPRFGYDAFTITAKLYQGDTLVDQAQMRYDCASIDPKSCLPESAKAPLSDAPLSSPIFFGVIALILLVGGIFFARRRYQDNAHPAHL